MNIASIAIFFGIRQEGDNRRVVFSGEGLVLLLHGCLLAHLFQLVCDIIVVPEGLLKNPVVSVIDIISNSLFTGLVAFRPGTSDG